MSARIRGSVLGVSLLVVLYVVIGALLGQAAGEGAYKQLAVFSEVLSRIRSDYVEAPNLDRVTRGALHGLLEALDPYSSYLSPREFDEYKAKQGQAEGDVGLVLSKRFGMFIVISTLPDSPAARAELVAEAQAGIVVLGEEAEGTHLDLICYARLRGEWHCTDRQGQQCANAAERGVKNWDRHHQSLPGFA